MKRGVIPLKILIQQFRFFLVDRKGKTSTEYLEHGKTEDKEKYGRDIFSGFVSAGHIPFYQFLKLRRIMVQRPVFPVGKRAGEDVLWMVKP
jgi:hypothetical protein